MNLKNSIQLLLLLSKSILPAKSSAPPTYLVESSTPWRALEPHEKDPTCFTGCFVVVKSQLISQKWPDCWLFRNFLPSDSLVQLYKFPHFEILLSKKSQFFHGLVAPQILVPKKFCTSQKIGTTHILSQLTTLSWKKPGFPQHGTQLLAAVVTSLPEFLELVLKAVYQCFTEVFVGRK